MQLRTEIGFSALMGSVRLLKCRVISEPIGWKIHSTCLKEIIFVKRQAFTNHLLKPLRQSIKMH